MRCKAITLLNRRCRCKSLYNNLCYTHIKKYHSDTITKIQSVWRSYLTRRRIKNLFVCLPHELQTLVLYFMREDHRISHLHKSYINIYNNKIDRMNRSLSELYYDYLTIYLLDFDEYIERKIRITDKIKYYNARISEIT